MFDIHLSAAHVADSWPAAVGKLPTALADAINAFDAARVVEEPHAGFDPSEVTGKNAADTVSKLAAALVAASEFSEARSQVLYALALRILRTAGAVVPEVLDSLSPAFEQAVAAFTEAVSELPDDLSSDALVAAGPAVLAAYHRALEAQSAIARIDGWIDRLRGLPAYAGYKSDMTLRVFAPLTRGQLQALVNASSGGASQLGHLNPLYVCAVNEGIEFKLNSPIEAAAIREEIEKQPLVRKPTQFLQV
jgi:hypothetical protein